MKEPWGDLASIIDSRVFKTQPTDPCSHRGLLSSFGCPREVAASAALKWKSREEKRRPHGIRSLCLVAVMMCSDKHGDDSY